MTLLKCCKCGGIFDDDCIAYHLDKLFAKRCPLCYSRGHLARIDKKNIDTVISALRKEVEE